jgi:hypothetical protein
VGKRNAPLLGNSGEATRGQSDHVAYREEIQETMGEISNFTADLAPIAVMTKSQKNFDASRVRTLKRHFLSIAKKIRSFNKELIDAGEEGVSIWWKLRALELHQWRFTEDHMMVGRVNSQGFKATHVLQNKRTCIVRKMPNKSDKALHLHEIQSISKTTDVRAVLETFDSS